MATAQGGRVAPVLRLARYAAPMGAAITVLSTYCALLAAAAIESKIQIQIMTLTSDWRFPVVVHAASPLCWSECFCALRQINS